MLTDFSWLVDRWPFLLRALWTTLYVSTLSLLLGFVIGILVGGLRSYGGRVLDLVLGFYVDSVRAIPPLALLVWTFFAFRCLELESFTGQGSLSLNWSEHSLLHPRTTNDAWSHSTSRS